MIKVFREKKMYINMAGLILSLGILVLGYVIAFSVVENPMIFKITIEFKSAVMSAIYIIIGTIPIFFNSSVLIWRLKVKKKNSIFIRYLTGIVCALILIFISSLEFVVNCTNKEKIFHYIFIWLFFFSILCCLIQSDADLIYLCKEKLAKFIICIGISIGILLLSCPFYLNLKGFSYIFNFVKMTLASGSTISNNNIGWIGFVTLLLGFLIKVSSFKKNNNYHFVDGVSSAFMYMGSIILFFTLFPYTTLLIDINQSKQFGFYLALSFIFEFAALDLAASTLSCLQTAEVWNKNERIFILFTWIFIGSVILNIVLCIM